MIKYTFLHHNHNVNADGFGGFEEKEITIFSGVGITTYRVQRSFNKFCICVHDQFSK